MKKRALILGSGGLYGSYSAGFVSELCRLMGPNYFDSVYCFSVGTTIGTFYVANQPEVIEQTWRNYVDGTKLTKPYNFLLGKPMLDLDYLISLFKGPSAHLNVKAVMASKVKLNYVLIDYNTGEIVCVRPNKKNIFNLIKAACSLPIVSGPSKVGKKLFFDAAFVRGGLPLFENIAKKHDETIVLLNFPLGYKPKKRWWPLIHLFFPIASYFYPKPLQAVFKDKLARFDEPFEYAQKNKNVMIITPNNKIVLGCTADTNKERLNKMIDLGKKDARKFAIKYLDINKKIEKKK